MQRGRSESRASGMVCAAAWKRPSLRPSSDGWRRFENVVGGQRSAVDIAEHTLVSVCAATIEHELAGAQPDDPLAVPLGEIEEVQVDDRRDAQVAVDSLQVA